MIDIAREVLDQYPNLGGTDMGINGDLSKIGTEALKFNPESPMLIVTKNFTGVVEHNKFYQELPEDGGQVVYSGKLQYYEIDGEMISPQIAVAFAYFSPEVNEQGVSIAQFLEAVDEWTFYSDVKKAANRVLGYRELIEGYRLYLEANPHKLGRWGFIDNLYSPDSALPSPDEIVSRWQQDVVEQGFSDLKHYQNLGSIAFEWMKQKCNKLPLSLKPILIEVLTQQLLNGRTARLGVDRLGVSLIGAWEDQTKYLSLPELEELAGVVLSIKPLRIRAFSNITREEWEIHKAPIRLSKIDKN